MRAEVVVVGRVAIVGRVAVVGRLVEADGLTLLDVGRVVVEADGRVLLAERVLLALLGPLP